jgi:hypothetical protein
MSYPVDYLFLRRGLDLPMDIASIAIEDIVINETSHRPPFVSVLSAEIYRRSILVLRIYDKAEGEERNPK